MTTDTVSIWISVFALFISALTFYFSLFHKKDSLVASLAKWTNDQDPSVLVSACEVAIFNNGNRDILIQSVEVDLFGEHQNLLLPEIDIDEIPCSLKAGESKLLRLAIPDRFIRSAQAANCLLKIMIFAYTIEGELRIATKKLVPVLGGENPSPLDWTPFALRKIRASDRH